MSIDPEKLMAFVDGELDEAERLEVERAIAVDPILRAEAERQRRLRSVLAYHYGPVAQEQVPDRLRALLAAAADPAMENDKVTSLEEARARRRSWPTWGNLAAIAASLVIGVIAGQLLSLGRGEPVGTRGGALVAQGGLARALETQLASAHPAMAPTRIGLTFVDHQGRACRTFDGGQLAGLACRDAGRWHIVVAAAAEASDQTHYRQAGSSPVMETAQQMMASQPFNPAAERAAARGGWNIGRR